ncbi:copper homeostasis protein CutC [bacterium]|nr:copper homeostasis protein CutC [bacterium]
MISGKETQGLSKKPRILFEACVDSLEGALAAQESGADRIELCSGLSEGGLTPSAGLIRSTFQSLRIPVHVLIRPRCGDFLYSDQDYALMLRDLELVKEWGAQCAVSGFLTPEGDVDKTKTAEFMALARPMSFTFHRAFDMVRDPFRSLEDLIALGADRILTSGGKSAAEKGMDQIRKLVLQAGGRISVMAGGGVDETNVRKIADETGVREIHATLRSPRESRMRFRNCEVRMGGGRASSEFEWKAADPERMRVIRNILE